MQDSTESVKSTVLEDLSTPQASHSEHSNRTNTSRWAYIKWIIWTVVYGIFNCRAPVFLPQFDDTWLVTQIGIDHSSSPSVTSETSSDSLEFSDPDQKQTDNIETNCLNIIPSNSVSVNGELPFCDHTHSSSEFSAVSLSPAPIEDSWMNICEELNPCTLLASYYVNTANGITDIETRDRLTETLIYSVLPRNLSTLSEISVKPEIRRMYAWSTVPADNSDERRSNILKLEVNSTTSDDQTGADPGVVNTEAISDVSISPHSTVESSPQIGETPDDYCNFNLDDVDRQDQNLAWAMSQLSTNSTEIVEFSGVHSPSLYASAECGRRSRDKSPITTINSAKISDAMSLPAFLPYDGLQSFESKSSVFDETTIGIPKAKRSSSLKSQRTPPGTPGQKAVRFADAFGLDLTTVHHVPNQEVPPKVPASATINLKLDTDESIAKIGAKQFGLCFAQPGAASNFVRRVLNQTVCLEDAYVDMPRGVLIGTIRVRSLGFEKRVIVRTSYNNWATFSDTPASYVQGSHDGATDRFSFSLIFPDTMIPGDRAQFAIRYETQTGEQFWDNNYGQNYSVTCYAKATDLAGDGSWVHYL